MLLQLSVANIVTIERLVFEPAVGFNVLTGETGAGKSMLVDALGLVLGGRARPDMVRAGAREAEVDALFELPPGSRAAAWLEAAGIPGGRELVVRRVVMSEGRSRAYLNGRLSTLAQLAELAPELCDIASQHESVTLTDASTHIEYLDAFGKLDGARAELARQVDELAEIDRALSAAQEAARGRAEREDFLTFQAKEIDELEVRPGEETTLEEECARLRHADKLASLSRSSSEQLYEGDGSVCDALGRIVSTLAAAAAIDASLAPLLRTAEVARTDLAELARSLSRYGDGIDVNPARLGALEDRLARLSKLLRKHGPTAEDVLTYRREIGVELASLDQVGDRIATLTAAREEAHARAATAARALSKKRRSSAERLARAIGQELAMLGMGRARVVVDVAPLGSSHGSIDVDGARLSRAGVDRVEFLIAPNRGEEPRPLRRIASGGELSRALLAIKRVLADSGPAGFYVFDEVDAGVSGAIAEVIGRAIADVARHRQVLCITHLPQIAALADAHFVVEKCESQQRTFTAVRRLTDADRVTEVARMIGGVRVGDAARKAASELLASRRA